MTLIGPTMNAKHLVALLALAAGACTRSSDQRDAAEPVALRVPGWRLERAATVGGEQAGEDEMLYGAQRVAEDPEGRFYVVNFGDRRIQVFDSAGTFVRTLGRKGQGPGEFTSPMSVAAAGADEVWVLEAVPARLIRYRRDTGEFIANVPLEAKQLIPLRMQVERGGRVAVEYKGMLQRTSEVASASFVAWVDPANGRATPMVQFDTITRLRHNRRVPQGTRSMVIDPPFMPQPAWALDGRGGVLFGDGAEFSVYRAAQPGEHALAFRGQGRPAAVTSADRAQFLESPRGKLFEGHAFPEHKPFFAELAVDSDGLVWVHRPGESGTQTWEVRRPDGQALGELRVPAGSRVLAVSDRSVYVLQKDELDVETLHRYRLIRG